MEELVLELKQEMDILAGKKAEYDQRFGDFVEETVDLSQEIDRHKKRVDELKIMIQPLALARFESAGEKKLYGGIGIREKTTLDYDLDRAMAFAKEKDMFLQLDRKLFEKAAPGLGLDFVTEKKIPQVTFPKVVEL